MKDREENKIDKRNFFGLRPDSAMRKLINVVERTLYAMHLK